MIGSGTEFFSIKDFDHVEFYVGNAKQVVHFYRSAFGFKPHAYCGPETGVRDRASYVLKQNNLFFVFTTPLSSNHPATKWLSMLGDGVRDIAIRVGCDEEAHNSCVARGAVSVMLPTVTEDGNGKFGKSSIQTYGDTIHSFIDDKDYNGLWAPNFKELKLPEIKTEDTALIRIDHIVGNVEITRMTPINIQITYTLWYLSCELIII